MRGGVGRTVICSLLREEYWGPYLFKHCFKPKSTASLFVSPCCCPPPPSCPLFEDVPLTEAVSSVWLVRSLE